MVADYGDKDLDWGLIILISYTGQASVHYLIFSTIKLELDQAGSITLISFCVVRPHVRKLLQFGFDFR